MVPLRYSIGLGGAKFTVMVSVFTGDGSVSVVHGGIEMGQGINTKVWCICDCSYLNAYLSFSLLITLSVSRLLKSLLVLLVFH